MIDNRTSGDVVYLQAFDKVPHQRLMGKGKICGGKKEYCVENGLMGKMNSNGNHLSLIQRIGSIWTTFVLIILEEFM